MKEKARKMQEASRVRADTLTKFARCSGENSLTHASLTLMLSTAQLVPSRSDGSYSLQPWQAMRSTASESLIHLLLHLSSPFGAGSRAEVVDAEKYKANCPTVLRARNFFHFQIEISPRRARQSLPYFVNRQSRSFQEIVLFSLFPFLDSFQTLKAQKDKKTQPRQKSENPGVTPDRRRRPSGLVTHRQKALDARSSTINKTRQCHGDRRHRVLSKVRESARIFPIPFHTKKSRHFRPRRPGRGCRGT